MNCSSDPQSSSKYHRGPGSMKWSKESSKPSSANEQPSQAQRPQPQLPHFEMRIHTPGPPRSRGMYSPMGVLLPIESWVRVRVGLGWDRVQVWVRIGECTLPPI